MRMRNYQELTPQAPNILAPNPPRTAVNATPTMRIQDMYAQTMLHDPSDRSAGLPISDPMRLFARDK